MSIARVNSLAFSFQEVLTAILRVRFERQQVQDAESFRAQMRRSIQAAMQEARALGYSSDTVQMSVFAVVWSGAQKVRPITRFFARSTP